MHNNYKALYLALMISVFSFAIIGVASAAEEDVPSNSIIKEIKDSQKKTTTMHTKVWNTPEPKNKKGDSKEAEKKSDSKEAEKKDVGGDEENTDETELTEDQKIWKKYNDLANKNKDGNEGDIVDGETDEDAATAEDVEPTDISAEGVEEEPEKEPTGITAILQRYKNSQGNKGNLTTRSLGSID